MKCTCVLLPQAYAKLHGGYSKIADVGIAYALHDLTAGRTTATGIEALI